VIQSIQSIYLALAFFLDISIYFNPLYGHAMNDPQLWIGIGFTAALAISAILTVVCIFLYNNRKNQLNWAAAAIALQTIAFGWGVGILISLGGFGYFIWNDAVGAGILLIALIAVSIARKKVKDDQKLVESMDRIR
jgi:hypothetical protein